MLSFTQNLITKSTIIKKMIIKNLTLNSKHNSKNKEHYMYGFSMVEMMIVMVIIGILCSFAVPVYQDYIVRAKVLGLLTLTQPIKMAVSEAIFEGVEAKIEKISNQDTAKEITVSGNVITIIGDSQKLGITAKDKTLKLTLKPTTDHDRITWKCTVEPPDFNKYVPTECKVGVGS